MATKPAHIKTAEKEGLLAGFDEWHEGMERVTKNGTAGLEPVRDLLSQVRKVGRYRKTTGDFAKPEKALQFYCNHYAQYNLDELPEVVKPKRTRAKAAASAAPAATPDLQGIIEALSALGIEIPGATDEDDEDDTGVEVEATPSNKRRASRTRKESKTAQREQNYEPSNPDADATQGRLWKLNQLGLLQIVDLDDADEDLKITNGEAHEAIAEALEV